MSVNVIFNKPLATALGKDTAGRKGKTIFAVVVNSSEYKELTLSR